MVYAVTLYEHAKQASKPPRILLREFLALRAAPGAAAQRKIDIE